MNYIFFFELYIHVYKLRHIAFISLSVYRKYCPKRVIKCHMKIYGAFTLSLQKP